MTLQQVETLTESQVADLQTLYKSEWWSQDRTLDDVRQMVENTSLIIGFGIAFLWQAIPDRDGGIAVREVTTGSNETATVLLDDGTVARLAPRSRLRLSENGGSREVSLVGRGYFAVAKRNGELFRVLTPQGEVTVLGTRFELNSDSEDLRLTVVEGTVELAVDENVERVESGQIARVLRGTTLPVQTVENPAELIDWMGNFLAFQATPLGEAVREIERLYGVTVLIEDPALSSRTVTSHFSDWPLATMIDALCLIAHANCSIEGDTVRMKSG